jgi:acylphosphatase
MKNIMETGVHIVVSGLVQGVGFRYFVYDQAKRLGLKGFVRNLFNGNVEIEAEGNRSIVEELIDAVKVGPRVAHVSDVKISWKQYENKYSFFEIQ